MFRGVCALAVFWVSAQAHATIADWRVNEVYPDDAQSPGVRYVELFVPPGTTANCLYPTTRLEVWDAQGQLLGTAAPFVSTVCYDAGTTFLLASAAAVDHFGATRDAPFELAIPAYAGQLCLASSQTRYDCARWGPIGKPIGYLRNLADTSTAASIPSGQALARVNDTGDIAVDFVVEAPTPGRVNDGSIYQGPDAGPAPSDAPLAADAGPPDGPSANLPDAREFFERPDARLDPRFLSADPGGGACQCQAVGRGGGPPLGWLALSSLALALRRAWRRRAGPRAGGPGSGRAACRCPR
jgi:hypothetical protein